MQTSEAYFKRTTAVAFKWFSCFCNINSMPFSLSPQPREIFCFCENCYASVCHRYFGHCPVQLMRLLTGRHRSCTCYFSFAHCYLIQLTDSSLLGLHIDILLQHIAPQSTCELNQIQTGKATLPMSEQTHTCHISWCKLIDCICQ